MRTPSQSPGTNPYPTKSMFCAPGANWAPCALVTIGRRTGAPSATRLSGQSSQRLARGRDHSRPCQYDAREGDSPVMTVHPCVTPQKGRPFRDGPISITVIEWWWTSPPVWASGAAGCSSAACRGTWAAWPAAGHPRARNGRVMPAPALLTVRLGFSAPCGVRHRRQIARTDRADPGRPAAVGLTLHSPTRLA
jgi:hypothetical protein